MPTFTGTTGADEIIGSEGDDVIDGRGGADRIYGRGGADQIRGVLGAVEVYGGAGDDTVTVGYIDGVRPTVGTTPTTGLIDGGDGYDTLVFDSTGVTPNAVLTVEAAQGFPNSLRASLSESRGAGALWIVSRIDGFERIVGPNLATEWSLRGANQSWTIVGGSGNDSFALGSTTVANIRGGAGNDIFGVSSGSQLFGEAGDDTFSVNGADGAVTLAAGTLMDGGEGSDTLLVSGNDVSRNLVLGDGVFGGATHRSIENLTMTVSGGQSGNPLTINVTGTADANVIQISQLSPRLSAYYTGEIRAGAGNDVVQTDGAQVIYGGTGDDILTGTIGAIYGEEGDDVLYGAGSMFGGDGDDIVRVGAVNDGNRYDGGAGIDTFIGVGHAGATFNISLPAGTITFSDPNRTAQGSITGFERVITGGSTDTITMSGSHDYVQAGGGADIVRGGAGNDIIYGDDLVETSTDGADQLFGDEGDDLIFGMGGNDTLSGGAGSDVLVGGGGSNTLDGGDGYDLAVIGYARSSASITYVDGAIRIEGLTGAADTLRNIEAVRFTDGVYDVVNGRLVAQGRIIAGTAGNDRLIGTAAADILNGGAGNDILRGGAGSDLIDGGAGIDTAVYAGTLRSYSTVSLSLVGGGQEGGFDQLSNIEVLRFLDGRLSFDTGDATTVVYRLYDAAFDRAPDVFGLADYSRAIQEGRATVQGILDIFEGSAEFQARYGALNNEQFVREMYRFSLNREGDAAGVASYVAALNAGTATRAQILGIFSESAEHQALINTVITSRGIFIQDEQTAALARLYDSVFNRLPDLGGLQAYRDALDNGYTLKDIAGFMVGSPEFQSRFGSLTNQQFVEQIYRFVLDREGDAAGVQSYVNALNTGTSRTDVVLIFSESQEHRFSYQPTFDNQIRKLGVNGYDPDGTGGGRAIAEDIGKSHDPFVIPAIDDLAPADAAPSASVAETWSDLWHGDRLVVVLDEATADATPTFWPEDIRSDPSGGHHPDWM
ncbi:DUF4214 domain-containing protein [Brevundimonas staleyi]|uniref:DUF4214 domain-containing protein n=1 Tax=Brevundimonas staleyi TaxID=74326 RepID=UPI0035A5F1DE